MEINYFDKKYFDVGEIAFQVKGKPVSFQNKNSVKQKFRQKIRQITKLSDFIITDNCWVAIDYYCNNIKRLKNPGVYDIDNIIKPIIDSLTGIEGLIIDDVIVDRVTVNWIDTPANDYIEIIISYPDMMYMDKENLVLLKFCSGWCFPTHIKACEVETTMILLKNHLNAGI